MAFPVPPAGIAGVVTLSSDDGTIVYNQPDGYVVSNVGIIDTANIAPGAVDTLQIKAGAVTSGRIAPNTITSYNIQNNTITGNDIANQSLVNANYSNDSVDVRVLQNDLSTYASSPTTFTFSNIIASSVEIAGVNSLPFSIKNTKVWTTYWLPSNGSSFYIHMENPSLSQGFSPAPTPAGQLPSGLYQLWVRYNGPEFQNKVRGGSLTFSYNATTNTSCGWDIHANANSGFNDWLNLFVSAPPDVGLFVQGTFWTGGGQVGFEVVLVQLL
jgi:hypothetical protein